MNKVKSKEMRNFLKTFLKKKEVLKCPKRRFL